MDCNNVINTQMLATGVRTRCERLCTPTHAGRCLRHKGSYMASLVAIKACRGFTAQKKESHPQIAGDSPIGTMSNVLWAGMRIDSLYSPFSFLNFTPTKYQKCSLLFWSRITTCVSHKGMVPHVFLIRLLDDAQGDIYLAVGHPITFNNTFIFLVNLKNTIELLASHRLAFINHQ